VLRNQIAFTLNFLTFSACVLGDIFMVSFCPHTQDVGLVTQARQIFSARILPKMLPITIEIFMKMHCSTRI